MDIEELHENCMNMGFSKLLIKRIEEEEIENSGYINVSGKYIYGIYNLDNQLIANVAWGNKDNLWSLYTNCNLFNFIELKQIYMFLSKLTEESIKEMN